MEIQSNRYILFTIPFLKQVTFLNEQTNQNQLYFIFQNIPIMILKNQSYYIITIFIKNKVLFKSYI